MISSRGIGGGPVIEGENNWGRGRIFEIVRTSSVVVDRRLAFEIQASAPSALRKKKITE